MAPQIELRPKLGAVELPELTVEWCAICALRPNPKNPRIHNRKQIRQLQASIRAFGFLGVVLIDENGMILTGHAQVEAALREGFTHVPVMRYSHLTDAQKQAFVIAANRIAEQAGWDRGLLFANFEELRVSLPQINLDISITGFSAPDMDLLAADASTKRFGPEDTIPTAPRVATSRSGDLWLLGNNRVLCGDAREPSAFERLLAGSKATVVFADPPYNVRVRSIGSRGRIKHPEFVCASGEMAGPEFGAFLRCTLENGQNASRAGAIHFVCMDWRHVDQLIAVGKEMFDEMINLVVWNKTNAGQGSFYRSQHELIAVFKCAGATHQNNIQLGRFGRNRSNVWTYPGINTFGKDRLKLLGAHPTVKPVALVADALLDCSTRGDVVLDQFAGSGTTILAAEKTGRVGVGIEFEPAYVDVIIRRWQDFTRLEAVLAGDGRTFEEIQQARHTQGQLTTTASS